jgi:Adenylate and Guanylate cyclase catalytic domain
MHEHMVAAARMESNGKKDCIHVSEATANLLMASGKQRWLTPRKDKVVAKGKGEMQTYWLEVRSSLDITVQNTHRRRCSGDTDADDAEGSSIGDSNSDLEPKAPEWEKDVSSKGTSQALGDRYQRLVDWNVDQLVTLLKKVAASRKCLKPGDARGSAFDLRTNSSVLEEVTEVVPLPKPGIEAVIIGDTTIKPGAVELNSAVVAQLHEFMTSIAIMYNDNSFHNVSLVQSTLALLYHVSFFTILLP